MMNKLTVLLVLAILPIIIEAASRRPKELELKEAETCTREKCQAPYCRCSAMALPKPEFKGHEKEIPQVGLNM